LKRSARPKASDKSPLCVHGAQRYTSHIDVEGEQAKNSRAGDADPVFWDTQNRDDPEMARQVLADATEDVELREKALEMATAAWQHRQTADRWVERVAPQCRRTASRPFDRNVLRMAVWELTNMDTRQRW